MKKNYSRYSNISVFNDIYDYNNRIILLEIRSTFIEIKKESIAAGLYNFWK